MSYDAMRHFADSWGLVFMGLLYLILIGWHFRPGGKRRSSDAAMMILTDSEAKGSDHG
ncbi:Cytochrome c oxidase subunit CcoQ [Sphingobium indicum BiD32]|uniref:Cytochrome c oxidase subunit CcoQ n=1 Tax=Sphingobium indicum BiD32 TaxID=1301087 RepID=N1MTR4_9SPHN|nr:cbb3-type cytochrome c oxidase subunit 3 [Sphingobium indicum]CCW18753.1 Cytochrome c oxidase subunit CcoQ [Sphingobium indicum BiD32]